MNTPLEILAALPLMDVIRLTWLVLKAKSIKDRAPFDDIIAKEWIIDTAGESVYNNFFLPLLKAGMLNSLTDESCLTCNQRMLEKGSFLYEKLPVS